MLGKRGHRTLLCTSSKRETYRRARKSQVPVSADIKFNSKNPLTIILNLIRLVNLLKRREFDLIISHWPQDQVLAVLARLISRSRTPLVRVVSHDVREPKTHRLNRLLYGRLTSAVLFSSERIRRMYEERLRLRRERSRVVHGGLELDSYDRLPVDPKTRSTLGFAEGEVLIGMVARFSSIKGHDTFFKAAGILSDNRENVRFLVAGYGTDIPLGELKAMAEDNRVLKRTTFLEHPPDVKSILSCIDVGVVASTGSEAISRVVLELMALAKPVVATSVGGIPEVVADAQTGAVIPPGEPEAMAQALLLLIDNPALRERMGKAGRRRLEESFDMVRLTSQFEDFLYEVTARPPA